jgi:hypothetical protein
MDVPRMAGGALEPLTNVGRGECCECVVDRHERRGILLAASQWCPPNNSRWQVTCAHVLSLPSRHVACAHPGGCGCAACERRSVARDCKACLGGAVPHAAPGRGCGSWAPTVPVERQAVLFESGLRSRLQRVGRMRMWMSVGCRRCTDGLIQCCPRVMLGNRTWLWFCFSVCFPVWPHRRALQYYPILGL